MATKTCPNGHQYDSNIYGDSCPFCPASNHTQVINPNSTFNNDTGRTVPVFDNGHPTPPTDPTIPLGGGGGSPRTVIHTVAGNAPGGMGTGRKLVGLLVSYSNSPTGEVFSIYEGRNTIGRQHSCDISFSTDDMMSGVHLLILYREAEGVFWAADQNSSNGTYVNGKFVSDRVALNTNDVIEIGKTKLVFLGIPAF